MTNQNEELPWFECAEDATKAAITAAAKAGKRIPDGDKMVRISVKSVAAALFSDREPEHAHRYFLDCLNPNRNEKITLDQHLKIANMIGEFDVLRYACAKANHDTPKRITKKDQVATLQRDFIRAIDMANQMSRQLQELQAHQS